MQTRDIVVIGTSAGGVEALSRLVADLPADFAASVFVVIHLPASERSILPKILSRRGKLPAIHPSDGEEIHPGRIYVGLPDYHLVIKPGYVHLTQGPKENRHRPAIDPLFRSAAKAYHHRVIAVVLSGMLDDGTAGLLSVKRHGGIAVVQDPDDAMYAGMPRSAIENVEVDHVLPLSQIPALLVRLTNEPVPTIADQTVTDETGGEPQPATMFQQNDQLDMPVALVCPECGGALRELHDAKLLGYRCHTGHAYSAKTLLAEQSESLEAALWNAIRMMKEQAMLLSKMAAKARCNQHHLAADRYEIQMQTLQESAELIRRSLQTKIEESA
jgi:two-component system chemotaxis response regulator CheB